MEPSNESKRVMERPFSDVSFHSDGLFNCRRSPFRLTFDSKSLSRIRESVLILRVIRDIEKETVFEGPQY